ncbi:unnamed protein product [Rhizoctonia solani]|uniref:Uncharacterized protein n=1 Tax=Rhizoctonia solani TaxID=456999 RepID=A0A8H3D0B3_9AGAM|nr:unnamed protein product [Rhizoctonia solani]
MAACISRPFTTETPAFDRSWADIMPTGAVVRPADVATRPHQGYSSSCSSAIAESNPSGRLNERTSWFSAKTAVWDPRILLQTIQTQDSEYTLRKAVEWGTKCNSDLSEEEKIDNVLRFLAHAVGLQTAISTDSSSLQSSISGQTSHSRNDSTWSNVTTASFSTSPQSDSASLLDFRCETPVMACRPSPTPSIRSYCMADRDEEDMSSISDPRLSSTASSVPDITSLPSSVCYSDVSDRDRAMEELREVVRNAIAIAEADDSAPLGLAELHAAARDITMARRAREKSQSPPGPSRLNSNTPPRLSTPSPSRQNSKPVLSLDTSLVDSATFTPLVRPTTFSRGTSPRVLSHQDGGCQPPSTPRMKPNKLHKARPPSPNDPIPLQTFKTISSPSPGVSPLPRPLGCPSSPTPLSLDNCRSHTPHAPESPTWSHGLLKNPFSLRLDVHIITDAISGLGIRKPVSPPQSPPKISAPTPPPQPSPILGDLSTSDISYPDSPIEDLAELVPEVKRTSSGTSEWQYLRNQSGDTDDTPILATPIDEWYLPQFTPIMENEGKESDHVS